MEIIVTAILTVLIASVVARINILFFDPKHCRKAWEAEHAPRKH